MSDTSIELREGRQGGGPADGATDSLAAVGDPFALLEALDVGILVQDRTLRIVYANAKATALLGILTDEPRSSTGRDVWSEAVLPNGTILPRDAHPGAQVLATGNALQGVVLGVRREDTAERVWIIASAIPQRAADGSVERVIISFSDVSVAQRTLRTHDLVHQAVFGSMTEGVVIHHTDGSIRAANAAAERVLGLTVDQMSGRHPMDPSWRLILPDGTAAGAAHIPSEITRRSGEPARALLGVHRPTGELAWLNVQATPLREPGESHMTGVLATFADVTAERQALAAFEASAAQLQRVLDAVPGVVYQYVHGPDRSGRLTFAAGRIEEFSGLDPELVRRDPQRLFALLDGASLDAIWRVIDETVAARKPFEQVLPFRHADGELRWARVYGVPQDTPEGALYTGVILDATREQRMRDALRRSQRREAMGDMAGGIAHNFNNMLAVILPNVQMARAQSEGEIARQLADAERAAVNAGDLVKRMLALGRAETREDAVTDLVAIVREALHICRQTFDRGIELRDDLLLREAWVRGHASALQQVVLNLLLNARDALAGVPSPMLSVQLQRGASQTVTLVVRDNGAGMLDETLQRIGEPFFTTKPPGRGTGLGLASVFHTIADAGGSVRVHSRPGEGTTFEVELPLDETTRARIVARSALEASPLHGVALIVDDEPMVRAALARLLTQAGMRAVTADGAEQALAVLRDGDLPDLAVILLDLSMPGMSGEQALPLLQAAVPGVPIVALSGHVPDTMALSGAAAILQKPLGQRELVDAVARAMRR